jgi:hypothetical protein
LLQSELTQLQDVAPHQAAAAIAAGLTPRRLPNARNFVRIAADASFFSDRLMQRLRQHRRSAARSHGKSIYPGDRFREQVWGARLQGADEDAGAFKIQNLRRRMRHHCRCCSKRKKAPDAAGVKESAAQLLRPLLLQDEVLQSTTCSMMLGIGWGLQKCRRMKQVNTSVYFDGVAKGPPTFSNHKRCDQLRPMTLMLMWMAAATRQKKHR